MDCKGGLMKRKHCLILIAVCSLALLLSLQLTRQTAQTRGSKDGYREGYLAGQADRLNGKEFNTTNALQHAFPANFFEQIRSRDEELHYNAFHQAWPSGYYDGWHGIPPWSEMDMDADRWSP